jgi:DNA-binding LacI/PurR family transcriptional regulator
VHLLHKRATIKDIARLAGVSTAAVSQALRPSANSNIKLQEETIERVKSVAQKLNYRPHSGARSIRSRQFGTLGYFVAKNGLFTHTPAGYMAGVHDAAEQNAYRITLIRLPHHMDELSVTLPSVFTEHNLDALVIESYSELSDRIHGALADSDFPVVYLNDRHEANSVYVNDVAGARMVVRYMLGRGYQKMAFVLRRNLGFAGPIAEMHHSSADRLFGYQQEMAANGVHGGVVELIKEVVGDGAELTDADWEQLKGYDALIAYDDDLANMIGRYCYRRGIRIPQDVAMASFNGDYGSLCSWQRLTTVKLPSYEMGLKATEMALELVGKGKQVSIPSVAFDPILLVGETA